MNGSFSGTSSTKSSASCAAHRSAPMATSIISGKAEALHRGTQLARGHFRAELADKRRCDSGVDTLTRLNGADHLEDLRLVCDRAERAVYKALAAGNALFVINIGSAIAVAVDGIHAAGCRARALLTDDGVILTDIHAAAAL